MLVDSHCHINFISYKADGDEVIKDFLRENYALVVVGSQESTSLRAIEYANKYERGVYASVGLHPIDLVDEAEDTIVMDGEPYTFKNRQEDFDQEKYRQLAQSSPKVVAIGEVGLDYYYFDKFPKDKWPEFKLKQEEALRGFIALAEELDKPIIFHGRDPKNGGADVELLGLADDQGVGGVDYGAYGDMLRIVKDEISKGRKVRGVIHCFGGNLEQAKEFEKLGFYIGFTGIITFKKKVEKLQEIVKEIPLGKILIETDAPFLSPEPYRGKRCLPQYVEFVAKKVAELKGVSYEEVAEVTTANARKLFGI
jgi:TatD DNase family protein